MIDQKLIDIWPSSLGRLYIANKKQTVAAPYSVAHLISGTPYGNLKSRANVNKGLYTYQVDVYTSNPDKPLVVNAIHGITPATFSLIKWTYVTGYNEDTHLHRHIIELTIRDHA